MAKLILNVPYVYNRMCLLEKSWSDLAQDMGVHRNTLRKYTVEPEKITLENISKLAAALKNPSQPLEYIKVIDE